MGGPWAIKPGARDKSRVEAIAVMYRSGNTLQQIGDKYGLSRERVRQILSAYTGVTAKDGGMAVGSAVRKREKITARDKMYMDKCGCSWPEYVELRRVGRQMQAAGHGVYRTPLYAFHAQRNSAHKRGIGWELSIWQWWSIWVASGKWDQRGRSGYVMCRIGDVGPYAVGNVFIGTSRVNSFDARRKTGGLPIGVRQRGPSFIAMACLSGRRTHLGSYPTPELAHAAYIAAVEQQAA